MEYIKIEKEYELDRQTTAVFTVDLPLHWVCSWSPSNEYNYILKFVLVNSDRGIDRRTAVTYVKLYTRNSNDENCKPLSPPMCSFTYVNDNTENVIEVVSVDKCTSSLKLVFEVNIPKESSIFYDLSEKNAENDRILVVGGEKFYINKAILSAFSPVFNNLFNNQHFEESKTDEIELKELDSYEFWTLLQVIFPSNVSVNGNNVEFLWKLADRFDLISVAKVCENVLCNMEGKRYAIFSIDKRMRIAELYDSDKLKNVLDQQMRNMKI